MKALIPLLCVAVGFCVIGTLMCGFSALREDQPESLPSKSQDGIEPGGESNPSSHSDYVPANQRTLNGKPSEK